METNELNYSPKLRKVCDEIKAILVREDIAGIVILHDIVGQKMEKEDLIVDGRAEYVIHLTPSYSMLLREKDGFRFRDVTGDLPAGKRREMMTPTYNLVEILAEVTGGIAMSLIELHTKVKKNILPGRTGKSYPREDEG